MKIVLIGYGKMGKIIEQVALSRGHQIVGTYNANDSLSELNADIAIEFTQPDAAVENILTCFEKSIPVVVGTTGWYDKWDEVIQVMKEKNGGLFTATNFSLGVNIFFHLNKKLAKMMNGFDQYNVYMNEVHHTQKLDHPSGTASTLAQDIVASIDRIQSFEGYLESEPSSDNENVLSIECKRKENVVGFHETHYKSSIDEIKISHNAFSREGFALGAVLAAEWMIGKTGAFGMNDLLNFE
jgi:4-hydroxy-tetrahydrodipicolinate reductase